MSKIKHMAAECIERTREEWEAWLRLRVMAHVGKFCPNATLNDVEVAVQDALQKNGHGAR